MANWDLYTRRLNINGNSFVERQVNSMQRKINDDFANNPSYKTGLINNEKEETDFLILKESTLGSDADKRRIIRRPNTRLNVGNVIYVNEYQSNWLCIKTDIEDIVYPRGIIKKCNYTLKWIDDSGELQSIPSIVTDKALYTDGLYEGKEMSLPDGKMSVVVQRNEKTEKILRDKRFILFKSAYKVTNANYTQDGIISFVMTEITINDGVDDLENQIADRWGKEATYEVHILNNNPISISLSQPLKLDVEVWDTTNNVKIDNPQLTYSSSNEELATVDENGNVNKLNTGNCVITIAYKNASSTLDLTITGAIQNNYSAEISGNSFIIFGFTSKYTCKFLNNGVEYDAIPKWTITDNDDIWIESVNGNEVILKASSNYYAIGTKVTLRCTDESTGTFDEIEVVFKVN